MAIWVEDGTRMLRLMLSILTRKPSGPTTGIYKKKPPQRRMAIWVEDGTRMLRLVLSILTRRPSGPTTGIYKKSHPKDGWLNGWKMGLEC